MQLTRLELYERVCGTPLSKLAPEFGLSGTALAAVCRQYQIPYPGSGYWTRKSLGLAAELPALPEGADETIEITPSIPKPRQKKAPEDRPILCEHERVIERSHDKPPRTIYDWRHYLAVIQRKPGALRNGAPFLELPLAFRQLQDQMLRRSGGDREMADILALVLHHDEQVVVRAVELALDAGVATKTHVLNLLHRLIDGKTTDGPDIDTPQALTLLHEPKANVERYDGLRVRIVGGRHAS